jgi:hypothetical protein
MTERYEEIINDLHAKSAGEIGPDFEQGVWSRISTLESKQLARGRNGLAAVMLIVALSAGMMTGEQEAFAKNHSNLLSGGVDYSPASLLHVTK